MVLTKENNNIVDSIKAINSDEMALSEHIEEFSQRLIFALLILYLQP